MAKMYKQYDRQRVDDIADPEERSQLPISTISGVSDAELNKPLPKSTVTVTEIHEGDETANQNGEASQAAKSLDSQSEASSESEATPKKEQKGIPEKDVVVNGEVEQDEGADNSASAAEKKLESATPVKNGPIDTESGYYRAREGKLPQRTQSMRSEHRVFSSGPRAPPFRIPEFRWSYLHQKLLSDLLFSIETDVQVWKR